ncbi:3-keto-disaccharide hydrolase [Novipirellula artificiosorum]|uniref:3-keto-alpha-glucoside-1,2-lyase/3-keto-2-hydroxy-glucal hydratase domain-containing protein n=1 Tax=Novipirellula artificiosorum TaxID=2528016 RepID=A0A5C6DGV8_9BACT|nr:DUF1080 domain-containing protein [Novipirellula artificiosorum]TWU34229.1 hypothetical protein Poly41_43750 [Novipirellula artificiosorum]
MLRFAWFFVVSVVALNPLITTAEDDFPLKSMSLFDGETLAGWEGNAYWFRVEDEAIVAGRLDEKIPHNEFLCTTRPFGDFELRLEAKLIGDVKNAGVQFRTKRIPGDTEVAGYQADMGELGGKPIWGALYDESRRRKFLVEVSPELEKKIVKQDGWNEIRVRCEGPRIQIFINGTQTVDYTEADPGIPQTGVIGLQIHSGPPTEAWYRKLRIRSL